MTQPQPKIIFFDIDETLYINREEKRVPESTKTALRLLKQKGIITAIATGRTIAVLPEKIKEVFPMMESYHLIAIFPMGYPEEDAKPSHSHTTRKSEEEFIESL